MKKIILTLGLIAIFMTSCFDIKTSTKTYSNMGDLLTDCEGYAVLVTIDFNKGNFDSKQYVYIIKDSTGTCRVYSGGIMKINAGDTLLIKN